MLAARGSLEVKHWNVNYKGSTHATKWSLVIVRPESRRQALAVLCGHMQVAIFAS